MRVCIHRGTQEVGGTCIEIASQGKRLVLDLGQPLNADLNDSSLPKVKGFTDFDESLLGLFISHPHLDHYGLVGKINPDIPILIGAAAKRIINSAKKFFPGGISIDNSVDLKAMPP